MSANAEILSQMPVRVQRKRTKGFKLPNNTVCVNRGTKWGNPFKVGDSLLNLPVVVHNRIRFTDEESEFGLITNEIAKKAYTIYLHHHCHGQSIMSSIDELKGKNLACFCSLNEPCHADVLLQFANQD